MASSCPKGSTVSGELFKLTGIKLDAAGVLSGPLMKKGSGKMTMGMAGRTWKLKHFVLQGSLLRWYETEQDAQAALRDGSISQAELIQGRFLDMTAPHHGWVEVVVKPSIKYDAVLEITTEFDGKDGKGTTLCLRASDTDNKSTKEVNPFRKAGSRSEQIKVTLTAWRNALMDILKEVRDQEAARDEQAQIDEAQNPLHGESSSSDSLDSSEDDTESGDDSTTEDDEGEETSMDRGGGVRYAPSHALNDLDHAPLRKGLASATKGEALEFQRIRLRPASPTKLHIDRSVLEEAGTPLYPMHAIPIRATQGALLRL